jgi:clathrin heavy chain
MDQLFKDAMETAAESKDPLTAEELLRYFVEIENNECFSACLYICYEFIRPDIVLELAWRHNMMDFAMPFMIQFLREATTRIDELEKANATRAKKDEEREKQGLDAPLLTSTMNQPMMITAGPHIIGSSMSVPGISRNYLPSSTLTTYPPTY